MKKSLKIVVSIFILHFLFSALIFAEGFHVCVASYQKLSNAQEMVSKLEKQSISAIISESSVKGKSYYRVLLAKEFKKIEDARKYRDEVKKYSFGKELNLKDFWVCKSEKIISPKTAQTPAPAPKTPAKLEPAKKIEPIPAPTVKDEIETEPKKTDEIPEPPVKNIAPEPEPEELPPPAAQEPISEAEPILLEKKDSVLSEETPFSVAVRSYKFEEFAENDKNRLRELGFNSYLVNTFDDTTFFAFNVHAGAFATRAEAEELQRQFTDAGIIDTKISDFADLSEKIRKYDEIITSEKVSFDNGRSDIPTIVPDSVAKLLREIPVNKNFLLEEFSLIDFDNYRLSSDKPEGLGELLDLIGGEESVHSAGIAKYQDALYRKDVKVFALEAENFNFEVANLTALEHLQLYSSNGIFDCNLYEDSGKFVLYGENVAEKLFVKIETQDFSQEEYVEFLNNSFNDSTLAIYPQLRRTLFVLPDQNPEIPRDFISFNLAKVAPSYAAERGNADWALLIVGHYLAKTFFQENSNLVTLGFYDLDYDYNAKSVHNVFMAAKNGLEISGDNQPVRLKDNVDGWYMKNLTQKEISFSTKAYVIAIDANSGSTVEKENLSKVSDDLKIWSPNATRPTEAEIIDAK